MLLSHDSLVNHYKTNFSLMHHHKWSLTELENLIPWERSIYIDLLQAHLKVEAERQRDERAQRDAMKRGIRR
jgi:hypothetical protein